MIIPNECFLYVDIAIITILLLSAFIAFKKGFLLQIISVIYTLVSIFLSWFVSPILAANFPLIKFEETYQNVNVTPIVNSFIYCVIFFVFLKIIYCFIEPLFKSVSDIPLIGFFNKIGGFVLGLLNGLLIVLLIGTLLNTPLVKNGKEVKENTIYKYTESLTNTCVKIMIDNINLEALKNKVSNFDVKKGREALNIWMKEQGIIND